MKNSSKILVSLLTLFALAGCSSPASSLSSTSSEATSSSSSRPSSSSSSRPSSFSSMPSSSLEEPSSSEPPRESSVPSSSESSEASPSSAVSVTGVTLNKASTVIVMGNTEQLVATIVPSGASEKGLSWSSSDEEVATVSSDGLVTALQGGKTTITVTTVEGGFTASCKVVVAEKEGGFYHYGSEFDLCDSKGGHTSTDYIRIFTYVWNMGTVNAYLSSCTYDVLTEDGAPVQSIDDIYVVRSPWIIEPGEYGFFTTVVSLSEARSDLKVVEHTVVKNARNEKAVRYDISNLTFGTDDLFNRLVIKGKVTNNTTKQASTLDQIVIILFDEEWRYLSTFVDALPVALQPGESCVFEASNLVYGGLDIAKEDVAHYAAFAFAWTYVY